MSLHMSVCTHRHTRGHMAAVRDSVQTWRLSKAQTSIIYIDFDERLREIVEYCLAQNTQEGEELFQIA